MKKNLLLIAIFCLLIQNNNTYAEEQLNTRSIDKTYKSIINSNISLNDKIIKLSSLGNQLSTALENQKLSVYNKKFINDLYKTNNEKIFNLKYENDRKQDPQIILEGEEITKLKNSLITPKSGNYIYNLVSNDRKLIVTNSNFEFVEGNSIKMLNFTKAYVLNQDVIEQLKNKKGVIINKTGTDKYFFIDDYKIEEKIPYSKLGTYTKGLITSKSPYLLENGIYYNYLFENFKFFEDNYGLYLNSLGNFGDISKYILYKKEDGKYVFISDYKKVKLISADIVYGIPGKYNFLREVLDDVIPPLTKLTDNVDDVDDYYRKLKSETQTLVKGLKTEEKVQKIYSWILENISYSKVVDFENDKIFSGILTYKNKDGVCTGYTKLFLFMISFAGVNDVEVIRGNVIDAQDFPDVGHAWIKKGDYYYDPTFDDPVGITKARTFDQYRYYKLPKDLFYTNRYDYDNTPEAIKTTTMDYRKGVVKKNLSSLVEKYKKFNFVLLKPYIFRKKYGYAYDEDITIENAKKIKPIYKVVNNYLLKDGQSKFITNLFYYTLTNEDFETFLEQFNYNIDEFTFLERDLGNGKKEYRAAKDIKF